MKTSQIFLWAFAGLTLCVGIVLIGVGSSFLVSDLGGCNNEVVTEPPTCEAGGNSDTVEVEFDWKYLTVSPVIVFAVHFYFLAACG